MTRCHGKVPGKGNWPKITWIVHHNPHARLRKSLSMHRVMSVRIALFDILFFVFCFSQISPENESFQEITRCSFSLSAYENTQ